MSSIITIDGAQGEGGGQMLRTSLSLAAVTGTPVRLINIRAGRSKPGLAPQHLTACRAVAAVCQGRLTGDTLRSTSIEMHPGPLQGGEYVFDVSEVSPSAGSVNLILQAILPPLLFARTASHITLRGGTELPWNPTFGYLQEIFLPIVSRMGVRAMIHRLRPGWYPAGGGEVEANIEPLTGPLLPLQLLQRGHLQMLLCDSLITDRLPAHILARQCQGVREALGEQAAGLSIREHAAAATSPGTTCLAAVRFENGAGGFTGLGERGKPAETVGREAGEGLAAFLTTEATVDERLADQLLLYAALADGVSSYISPRLTGHLKTHAQVIHQILGRDTEFVPSPPNVRVQITGIGFEAQKR